MTNIFNKMEKIPLHPILFALSPILFFYSYNKAELSVTNSDFLIALGISIFAAAVLVIVLRFLTKSTLKAAIVTSLLILLFFTYGHVRGLIKEFNIDVLGIVDVGPDKVLLSVWGAIFLTGAYLTLKIKKDLKKATGFLNFVAAATIVLSLADIIPYEIRTYKPTEGEPQETLSEITAEVTPEEAEKFPDIYYLIFDRYGNGTSLKDYFDFDNSEFTGYLEDEGFLVAQESFANYPRTFNSLASSLNMGYLDQLTERYGEKYGSIKPMYKMIENNKVVELLKEVGYKYIHISSWYPGTKKNKNADITFNYRTGIQSNFLDKLLESTALDPILQKFFRDDPRRESSRRGTLYEFEKLNETITTEGPKFVFAHFLIPHDPYVFDQDGNSITQDQVKKIGTKAAYLNQLIFVNKKIKEFVSAAKEKPATPPVIVIQSDEGPFTKEWSKSAGGPEDLREITIDGLKAHIRILNAYYLPGLNYEKVLYQDITPVNTFRVIFNNYFGTNHEMLDDKSYIYQDSKHLYKFIDVTEEVRFD